ncbi:MAG: phosphatidate cytidylyltransferase [Planctomycetota bacterium]|jgi:phosphatidate cytidylyltransferase
MRKILVRTATGASLAGAVALLIWLADTLQSSLPVLIVGALLAAACGIELLRMPGVGPSIAVYALVGVGLVSTVLRPVGRTAPSVGPSPWAAAWAVAPLPLLAWVHLDFGTRGLVVLIVLSKVGDIAGYYVGSAIGKHHPFKRLSPGKTTEGCLGSLVAGGIAGAAFGAAGGLPGEAGPGIGALVGLSINVASQAGDLLESYVKRTAGVKDSSTWLGASGGFLDVTDSLLLSVPVALLTWGAAFG